MRDWYGTFTRFVDKLTNFEFINKTASWAIGKTIDEINSKIDCEAISRDINKKSSIAANKTTNRVINKVIDKTNCKTASKIISRDNSRVVEKVIDIATITTISNAISETDYGKTICKSTNKANSKVTGRIWTDITIILTNLLTYTKRLEK